MESFGCSNGGHEATSVSLKSVFRTFFAAPFGHFFSFQEQEIQRRERELDSTVRRPAEAEKYRLEKIAEANRNRQIMEAEADAEAEILRGEAKAFAIEARAKAEAEQVTHELQKIAESLNRNKLQLKMGSFPMKQKNSY